MRVGKLDQQIQFNTLSESKVDGELVQSYVAGDTVWAQVVAESASESFQAARTNARETIRVLVHYRDDVTTKWQLVWNGQTYNITAVDRTQRRDKGELWLMAEVVGAA